MPTPRTPEEVTSDQRSFRDVRRVLAGELRVPLDVSAWKMLRLMLHDAAGCDILLTASTFRAGYGSGPGASRYLLDVAPACVSQLMEWSGTACVEGELHALLPATTVQWKGLPTWPLVAHHWWVREEDEQVTMALRPGEASPAGLTWPAPSQSPRWRLLEPSPPCPHCQRPVDRARDLGDVLVCPHCARSFRLP
jgi:hypothetical protein